jgi:hypothetical protein
MFQVYASQGHAGDDKITTVSMGAKDENSTAVDMAGVTGRTSPPFASRTLHE